MGFHGDCLPELEVSSFLLNGDGGCSRKNMGAGGKTKSWS